jgi:hypothetical protein
MIIIAIVDDALNTVPARDFHGNAKLWPMRIDLIQ